MRTRFRSASTRAPLTAGGHRASARTARSGSRQESNWDFVNGEGEFNAISKQDLKTRVASFVDDYLEGHIVADRPSMNDNLTEAEVKDREQLIEAARQDRTNQFGGPLHVMGETLGDQIWETTGRIGFGRKFLFKMDVTKGYEARFRVRQKNVVSWIVTKDSYIPRSVVNQPYLYPEVVTIPCYVTISDNDEATAPSEFMDEKFQDGLEAQIVREDNIVRYLFTQAAPVFNDVFTFTDMTPALWSAMQLQVNRWGLPCPHCVMAIDLWTDLRTNTDFQNVYEPVSKLQLIEEGRLGKLYDVEIYTDGLRYDTLQVLNPGEIFFLASPIGLGGIADYSPLQTEPISMHNVGVSARGWYMWQSSGYVVGNSRGVVWGYRTS
jgi:hypothetical protein